MYIRVVSNIHRWDGTATVKRPEAKVCGDAITDLKTSSNMLSVWNVDGENQIEESVAVIALGRDRLDKVSYVMLENEAIIFFFSFFSFFKNTLSNINNLILLS